LKNTAKHKRQETLNSSDKSAPSWPKSRLSNRALLRPGLWYQADLAAPTAAYSAARTERLSASLPGC